MSLFLNKHPGESSRSYLLIQEIAQKGDLNSTLIEVTNSKWNLILHELIVMSRIVEYAKNRM